MFLIKKEHCTPDGEKVENKFTCREILDELRDMNFYKILGKGFVPTYKRTELTDTLREQFGFRTGYEIVNTKERNKILKIMKK